MFKTIHHVFIFIYFYINMITSPTHTYQVGTSIHWEIFLTCHLMGDIFSRFNDSYSALPMSSRFNDSYFALPMPFIQTMQNLCSLSSFILNVNIYKCTDFQIFGFLAQFVYIYNSLNYIVQSYSINTLNKAKTVKSTKHWETGKICFYFA